jgi:hypothetical protein
VYRLTIRLSLSAVSHLDVYRTRTNELTMMLKHAALLAALSMPGAFFTHAALAQSWDSTPPNARTIGNPPTFIDTPALGVPVEGRAAAEGLYSTYDDAPQPVRRRPRVYIDPD